MSRPAAGVNPSATDVAERVNAIDWARVSDDLDANGSAPIERLISPAECEALASLYPVDALFRSRVVMARHGFGRGEYKYFGYPLPEPRRRAARRRSIRGSRRSRIAGTTRWESTCASRQRHADFLERCHAAGQRRPTPLLLQYGAGDYNCLHQDLYGEHVFPLQVDDPAVRARAGLRRRRVRDDRAAPANAVARRGRAACARATRWCSRCTSARCRARAARIASICATA